MMKKKYIVIIMLLLLTGCNNIQKKEIEYDYSDLETSINNVLQASCYYMDEVFDINGGNSGTAKLELKGEYCYPEAHYFFSTIFFDEDSTSEYYDILKDDYLYQYYYDGSWFLYKTKYDSDLKDPNMEMIRVLKESKEYIKENDNINSTKYTFKVNGSKFKNIKEMQELDIKEDIDVHVELKNNYIDNIYFDFRSDDTSISYKASFSKYDSIEKIKVDSKIEKYAKESGDVN